MSELTLEVLCSECGNVLDVTCIRTGILHADPCRTCLSRAESEGYDRAHEEADNE